MKTITAKILDATHLELAQPIARAPGEYIEVSIPDTDDEEEVWREAGKKHFLEAYAEEDAIYDEI